ncbi:hypothetical protein BJ322DRAFT_114657 [Thelephora terrestris]|uniref:histone deacetylase n=1 Tax=Thelephora terrestris TaxID=56493 RepID=A0A9P6HTM2_9AGAM|nr:hypothetical protein BJ322DRAFT_114657 [Thelephora terrestris]
MKKIPCQPATQEDILTVHSADHWDKVMSYSLMTDEDIEHSEVFYGEKSLYVCRETPMAARFSCGGVLEAGRAIARGEVKKAFAIVRPPGHHAEPLDAMGFCFFNNVAVATKVLQATTQFKRILILDWDVHHGNGTQLAFLDDPSVLYISIHRYDQGRFYPSGKFGNMKSRGEGAGFGYSVNVPWPSKGMGDAEYLWAFQKIVMPIAMEFSPDLVIISAGFDAAEGDELGECNVTPTGYAHMTAMLCTLAEGRVLVALEGGYNLKSIASSAVAVTETLLGRPPPSINSLSVSEYGTETVWLVAREQSSFWKSIDVDSCQPRPGPRQQPPSLEEQLKLHRQAFVYSEEKLASLPLLPDTARLFTGQVASTQDFETNDVAVFFLHEFGKFSTAPEQTIFNVHEELTRLTRASSAVINWARKAGYSLIDVNISPTGPVTRREERTCVTNLLTYIWDNYLSILNAKHIIIIAQDAATYKVMDLLDARSASVMDVNPTIIQLVDGLEFPVLPRNPSAGDPLNVWYIKHSRIFVPAHRVVPVMTTKDYGSILMVDGASPGSTGLLLGSLSGIQKLVTKEIEDARSEE